MNGSDEGCLCHSPLIRKLLRYPEASEANGAPALPPAVSFASLKEAVLGSPKPGSLLLALPPQYGFVLLVVIALTLL